MGGATGDKPPSSAATYRPLPFTLDTHTPPYGGVLLFNAKFFAKARLWPLAGRQTAVDIGNDRGDIRQSVDDVMSPRRP